MVSPGTTRTSTSRALRRVEHALDAALAASALPDAPPNEQAIEGWLVGMRKADLVARNA